MEFVVLIFLFIYVVAYIIQSRSPHTPSIRDDAIEYVITDGGDVIECNDLDEVANLDEIDLVVTRDLGLL